MICVDWDERSLRVIEAGFSRSGVHLRRAVHVPLGPGVNSRDPAEMGDFINLTLREHRIRAKKVLVDVPRQDLILNLITLPKGTRDELTAMVHAQMGKELPFSKDQAAIDFAVVPGDGGTTCDLWVAAVRTNIIEYYQQTLEAAGLTVERIGLRSYANQAAVVESGDVAGRTVLVDIGPSMTEISVIRDARLVYSRAAMVAMAAEPARTEEPASADLLIPRPDDSASRQGSLDALLIEVSRTIQAYRASDPGAKIDRIILSGTGGVDERARAAFESRFGSPTRIFEAPVSLNWKRVAEVSAAPFVAAIGLTYNHLAAETERFDFLHPKEPEAERKEGGKRRRLMVVASALFVAAALVLVVQLFWIEQGKIDKIVAERQRVERQIKEFETLQKKAADLEQWQKKNVVWIDKLKLLAESFVSNEKAYITDLLIKDTGEMTITLASTDSSVGTKLADEFRKIATSQPATASKKPTSMPEFTVDIGKVKANPKDDVYKFIDTLTVRLKSLEKPKTTKGKSG